MIRSVSPGHGGIMVGSPMSETLDPSDGVPHEPTALAPPRRHAGVDTLHIRNVLHARLFGEIIDPIRVGRFPILQKIGRGAMGTVYAAYDNELDRKIALKLLHAGADDALQRPRLLREARALARLSHPGVVQIYEVGEHEGRVYLAMEFVAGVTLRAWLEQQTRSAAEILDVLVQAARGLAAAHECGLVHRDVKPDNIVVGGDGRVRLVDFGLAIDGFETRPDAGEGELAARPLDRLTQTRGIAGTPAYMAPEQLSGAPADVRSDQFAFAVTVFEAVFGGRPFDGDTLRSLLAAMAAGPPSIPRRSGVDPRVGEALRRALRPRGDERFDSIRELAEVLQRPARRFRWRTVTLVAAASVALLFAWAGVAALGRMVSSATRAMQERDDAIARADRATLGEIRALVAVDRTAALARLTELSVALPDWADEVRPIVEAIASAPIAESIVELPAGWLAIDVDADGRVVVTEGARFGRLDVDAATIAVGAFDVPRGTKPDAAALGVLADGRAITKSASGIVVLRAPRGDAIPRDRDGLRAWIADAQPHRRVAAIPE
jgi:tRNA A-37 threonylcarbamoyl transferase component Bud32